MTMECCVMCQFPLRGLLYSEHHLVGLQLSTHSLDILHKVSCTRTCTLASSLGFPYSEQKKNLGYSLVPRPPPATASKKKEYYLIENGGFREMLEVLDPLL